MFSSSSSNRRTTGIHSTQWQTSYQGDLPIAALSAKIQDMHELSIVEAILEQVREEVRQSGATGRVTRLDLVIGRLSGVSPDSIRFAFELLGPGTLMEQAQICIREPAAVCACRGCGARSEIDELVAVCPRCASQDVAIEGGQELILQSIEVDP